MQSISNPMPLFLRDSVTNGNPQEQALIRRWWHEEHGANGRLVWEYPLCGRWVDAIWFPDALDDIMEQSGLKLSSRFPLANSRVVLCEAKHRQVTPELIGQALVYTSFARRAGATVERTVIFADTAAPDILAAAVDLGLEVILTDMSSAAAPTSPKPNPEFSLP